MGRQNEQLTPNTCYRNALKVAINYLLLFFNNDYRNTKVAKKFSYLKERNPIIYFFPSGARGLNPEQCSSALPLSCISDQKKKINKQRKNKNHNTSKTQVLRQGHNQHPRRNIPETTHNDRK